MQQIIHEHFNIVVPGLMALGAAWIWYDYLRLLRKLKSCRQPSPAAAKPTPEMTGVISSAIRSSGKNLILIVTGLIALLVRGHVVDHTGAAILAWTFVGVLGVVLVRYMTHGLPDGILQRLIRKARQLP